MRVYEENGINIDTDKDREILTWNAGYTEGDPVFQYGSYKTLYRDYNGNYYTYRQAWNKRGGLTDNGEIELITEDEAYNLFAEYASTYDYDKWA